MNAGVLVVVAMDGTCQRNQKESTEDDDSVWYVHNRKVIFIRLIGHGISCDKYFSFYLSPINISRINPPTTREVDTITAVALTMSFIPNSFINTAKVATQGKYI